LLGWKIDIKSEEEKRQEVESQMAALVQPGAPVSVLLDYGMSEAVAEKLVESGVGTIERLGSMTPEELEAIPGIEFESVEFIQQAVVAYYSQFEPTAAPTEDQGDDVEHAPEPEQIADPIDALVEAEAAEIAESHEQDVQETSGTIEDAGSPANLVDGADAASVPEE